MDGPATYSDDSDDSEASGEAMPVAPAPCPSAYSLGPAPPASAAPLPSEEAPGDPLLSASRAYQLEMFEASMRCNVIVAMDTGTGKTRIAILRIRAELERSPPPKVVWFLAPNVVLCQQQFAAIRAQIPGSQGKIMTGDTGVDSWSTQDAWDAALLNVRFVVATPQVLLDALGHGFVKMASIPLLVIDEAHGCVKESPGRRIMTEFYHRLKGLGQPTPAILGLTASPVLGSDIDSVEVLEQSLDAVCVTPTRHRVEFIAHTKRPQTFRHVCAGGDDDGDAPSIPPPAYGGNLGRLQQLGLRGDLGQLSGGVLSGKEIQRITMFFENFCRRAGRIDAQLGRWAAEYYVYKVVRRCRQAEKRRPPGQKAPHLLALLQQVGAVRPAWPDTDARCAAFLAGLSSRVQTLVAILVGCQAARPTGIVFVQERPMAAVLVRVLSLHPLLRSRFRAGHVVGMSQQYSQADLDGVVKLGPRDGNRALRRFRARRLNLLVATSVIEEGIDIPACNLVVCIDELTSLKAFVQRRGRAREANSEFHLLVGAERQTQTRRDWEALEAAMKRRYESDARQAEDLRALEAKSQLSDDLLPPLFVPATGARLRARDAKSHLQHFCATTSSAAFVDGRPVYLVHAEQDTHLLSAEVRLPATLPAHLRTMRSQYVWQAESDACADAAFQAYRALHEAGLLSDNLLPPRSALDGVARAIESRPGMVAVQGQYRPWPAIYEAWEHVRASPGGTVDVFRHAIRLVGPRGSALCDADLVLPCALPAIPPFVLFWAANSKQQWTVHIGPARRQRYGTAADQYHDDSDHAGVLLGAAYGHRWPLGDQHRLVRVVCTDEHLHRDQVAARAFDPQIFAAQAAAAPPFATPHLTCLVRDEQGVPFAYQATLAAKPPLALVRKTYRGFDEAPEDAAYVALRAWPKVVGLLCAPADAQRRRMAEAQRQAASTKPYQHIRPAATCRVDGLPMAYVQLGALLPSLAPVLEVHLVAEHLLARTPLGQLAVRDWSLVATALSAPSARLPTNYENLEFLGDSILKLCATVNCAAQNLYSPEGHLSLFKDRLVNNARLCRAALDLGLDRYVVAKQWALKPWIKYCDGLAADGAAGVEAPDGSQASLEMSTKTLADVVEALVGACHEDGGMPLALQCLRIVEPDAQWLSLEACRDTLYAAVPDQTPWTPPAALEQLLGYTFTKKALLAEAMTHASVPTMDDGSGAAACACMERLEFVGDAVLDHVLVQTLARMRPRLSYYRMHLLRTTLANAGFLGFATMAFSIGEAQTAVAPGGGGKPTPERTDEFRQPLWAFMRHGAHREMAAVQQAAAARFAALQEAVAAALWTGRAYPWALLARLRADKFYSDVLEAVIGALWVDAGTLAPVEALLEAVGVMPYLRRAVTEDLHLVHPKEELGNVVGSARVRYEVTAAAEGEGDDEDDRVRARHEEKQNAGRKSRGRDSDGEDSDSGGSVDSDEEEDEEDDDDDGVALAVGRPETTVVYACRLFVDDECLADVGDGVSREEVETRAAELAVQAWKARRSM